MARLNETSSTGSGTYEVGGAVTYQKFRPKFTKPLLDEIDALLAVHYGLADEESISSSTMTSSTAWARTPKATTRSSRGAIENAWQRNACATTWARAMGLKNHFEGVAEPTGRA